MKRSLKKAVAFILSLVLVTQLFVFKAPSAHVYASELSDFEISEDGTAIYGYYGTDDDIVIPADCGIEMVSLYMYGTEKTLTDHITVNSQLFIPFILHQPDRNRYVKNGWYTHLWQL